MAEQWFCKPPVPGSSPGVGSAGPWDARGTVPARERQGVPSEERPAAADGRYCAADRKKTLAGSDPCDWLKNVPNVVPIEVRPS